MTLTAAAGLTLYLSARQYLLRQFDASLERTARILASTIEVDFTNLDLGLQDLDMSDFASPDAGAYLEIRHETDTRYRSPSLGDSFLDEHSLDQRLDANNTPRELTPIVEQVNALLGRLHLAFDRERAFSANIAHELRTPLSGLRMTLEVTRSRQRSTNDYEQCLDQLLEVVDHMQRLVEHLLQLTKLDAGRSHARLQPVDLDTLIRRAWEEALEQHTNDAAFTHDLQLHLAEPIHTDPDLLKSALGNILHNALTYVDPDGAITITTRSDNGDAIIHVANSGSAVDTADAPRVFDRFWRADAARADTGARFGLGLTITRLTIKQLGGHIAAESTLGGAFAITITIPSAPAG